MRCSRTGNAQGKRGKSCGSFGVDGIDEGADGASWTATVGDELVERAIHLVRQTGGTVEL